MASIQNKSGLSKPRRGKPLQAGKEDKSKDASGSRGTQPPTPEAVRRTRYREKMAKAGMVQIAVFMPAAVVHALDAMVTAASKALDESRARPDRASVLAELIRQAKGRKR